MLFQEIRNTAAVVVSALAANGSSTWGVPAGTRAKKSRLVVGALLL